MKNSLSQNIDAQALDFEGLMLAIAPTIEQGGIKYESVRLKLIRFFSVKGSIAPEENADEVFDRVTRRIAEGEILDRNDPDGYFMQTARFVFLEECRSWKKKVSSLDAMPPNFEPFENPIETLEVLSERIEKEKGLEVLAECRKELSSDEILMIDVYDFGTGRERIERRNALADKLGKSMNSLRIDVCRTNNKLKKCAVKKLENIFGRKL